MSDEITTDGGGPLQVSPDELRAAAQRVLVAATLIRESADDVRSSHHQLDAMSVSVEATSISVWISNSILLLAVTAETFAARILQAADTYETADLLARSAMSQLAPLDQARLAALRLTNSTEMNELAQQIAVDPNQARDGSFLAFLPPVTRKHFPLQFHKKTTASVFVPDVAPHGAADLAKRIPDGKAQIRVEKYVSATGENRFLVSVSGTRNWSTDSDEPFDMRSNAELFTGHDSRSLEAVRLALEDAGAKPSDWVLLNTHSQAGMIGELLTRESAYDVDTLLTWGSPTDRPIPGDVTRIDVAHTDDPVTSLAKENPLQSGSAHSVNIRRDTELRGFIDPHLMPAYEHTGALMDASGDPRLTVPELGPLQHAEKVFISDYEFTDAHPGTSLGSGVGTASTQFTFADEKFTDGGAPSDRPEFRFADPSGPESFRFDLWPAREDEALITGVFSTGVEGSAQGRS